MKSITGGGQITQVSITNSGLRMGCNQELASRFPRFTLSQARKVDGHYHLFFRGAGKDTLKVFYDKTIKAHQWKCPVRPGHDLLPKTTNAIPHDIYEWDDGFVVVLPEALPRPINRIRKIKEAAIIAKPSPEIGPCPPTFSLSDLQSAVRNINALKASMGEALVLSVTPTGALAAMIEIV